MRDVPILRPVSSTRHSPAQRVSGVTGLRSILIASLMVAAGCGERASAKLERQYEILQETGRGDADLCQKAREVANAYLAEENSFEYQVWDVRANSHCLGVSLERL